MTTPEPPGDRPLQRVRRPEPARSGPVRAGWLGLFAAPGAARVPGAEPARPQQDTRENEGPVDPMARAVELGYRVVDDYIRQGQNAARLIQGGGYGPRAARQDAQEFAVRFFQYASEMAAMWLDVFGMATTLQPPVPRPDSSGEPADGPAAARRAPAAGGAASPGTHGTSSRPRVSVCLEAARPVEVRADVRPPPDGSPLRVHELRSASATLPNLRDVAVESADGGELTVRIRVPPDQPPGVYAGVVVDERTDVPVGTIELRILARDADR